MAFPRFLTPYRPKNTRNTTSRSPYPFKPGPPFGRDPPTRIHPSCTSLVKGKVQGVPAREGVPARGFQNCGWFGRGDTHEPGPPNEPGPPCHSCFSQKDLGDHQITHPICVLMRHLQYDFLGACFGPPSCRSSYIKGPKQPLTTTHSKCLRRTQIG